MHLYIYWYKNDMHFWDVIYLRIHCCFIFCYILVFRVFMGIRIHLQLDHPQEMSQIVTPYQASGMAEKLKDQA